MLNALIRIEIIENGVSVALISSSENDHIEVFADVLDDFFGIWPNMNIAVDYFALNGLERDFELVSLEHEFICVNEGFIHVEHNCFPILVKNDILS
jgi:hypothetical protein